MQWIILFGGAGREATVSHIINRGLKVLAIIVPLTRNAKLESAVSKLRELPCDLIESDKDDLDSLLRQFHGNAILSVGFPYLIPSHLLKLFQPAINIHPTLLPRYRGPTSGAYILINNERESGSTVHHMTSQMDRGDIVLQSRVPLTPFDTIRSMQRKVYALEQELLVNALAALENGVKPITQDESQASEFSKKRTPADSELDPSKPLIDLVNQIRACDPREYPAFFIYNGQKITVQLQRLDRQGVGDDEM
jgi:methionyl-tRNA formyltransferase